MDYAKVWFLFWAVLWTGYFALDGFDLGVGFAGWLAARSDAELGGIFASVGPFWDGNEVWLITAGGATFAAFPAVYAGLFSWLYPALFLILFALIARGVALEFRTKVQDASWRLFWERTAGISSLLVSLLFGVAFGNIFRGLEISAGGYGGTFLGLLNPYALLTGLLFCAFFAFHGLVWISFKTCGPAADRAAALAAKVWYGLLLLVVLFVAASWRQTGLYANFLSHRFLAALPALLVAALLSARLLLVSGKRHEAFLASFAGIVFFSFTGFAGIYPALLPSRADPSFSLTLFNSASSAYTLRLMTWVVLVFLPVIIWYQAWVYRLFRQPLTGEELKKNGMY